MSQGSCAGPVLYLIYTSTLQTVIAEGIDLNGFVDNHNVKKSFGAGNKVDEKEVISGLEWCTTRIHEWMNVNRLKINTDNTEFILEMDFLWNRTVDSFEDKLSSTTVDFIRSEG